MTESRLELVWSRAAAGGGAGPFRALLDAAEEEPEAAEGLALAYASMPLADRARLVETILADGEEAGRSMAGPLALLMSVEEDETLARAIARGLDGSLSRRGVDGGWVFGDVETDAVVLVRHLHGAFVEVIAVAVREAGIEVDTTPLRRHDEAAIRQAHGVPEGASRIPLAQAVDALAAALWRARRRGLDFPEGLRGLAHLFTVAERAAAPIDVAPLDGVD